MDLELISDEGKKTFKRARECTTLMLACFERVDEAVSDLHKRRSVVGVDEEAHQERESARRRQAQGA